jgi:hypothetical protein
VVEEVLRQQRHVVAPFAHWRRSHAKDAQAVEQVLAEAALGDVALEIMMGSGENAYVDLDGLVVADAPDFTLIQDAQQARLQIGRAIPDLVEEERAAVGLLEEPLAVLARVGERAALVPKSSLVRARGR